MRQLYVYFIVVVSALFWFPGKFVQNVDVDVRYLIIILVLITFQFFESTLIFLVG